MTITLTREEAQSVLYALSKGIRRNDWKPVCDAHNEMKMRLAQPEPKKALVMRGQKDKVVAIYRENDEDIIRAEMPHEELLRAQLSAPKPEPVAWLHSFTGYGWQVVSEKLYPTDQPLYTAPPQREEGCAECGKKSSDGWALYCVKCSEREWQGLTDEEIKDILDCGRPNLVNIKKAEQKLKEKNG